MRPGQAPCLTGLRCFPALLPHHPPCPCLLGSSSLKRSKKSLLPGPLPVSFFDTRLGPCVPGSSSPRQFYRASFGHGVLVSLVLRNLADQPSDRPYRLRLDALPLTPAR